MSIAAKDVMRTGVSLHVDDRGSTLVHKLSGQYHALPVVNDEHEVVGIVSEASILKTLRQERTILHCTARSLMTCGHYGHRDRTACSTPLVVSPDAPLPDVLQTILKEQMSIIPVAEDNKLVGIVSRRDLLRHSPPRMPADQP